MAKVSIKSEIYFCGGDCVEDVTSHLMPHLSLHPGLKKTSRIKAFVFKFFASKAA